MTRENWKREVKHALIDKEMTMAELINTTKYSHSYVYGVLNGTFENQELVEHISNILGVKAFSERG